jgi:putative endonuclease
MRGSAEIVVASRADAPADAGPGGRAARGRVAHRAGVAAEDAAARAYERRGARVLARRWRRSEGEIDLVVAEPDGGIAFVEVKAGRRAAEAISARQWARLEAAALRYIVEHRTGDAPVRFDAALVAADGAVTVVENARGFDEW